MTAKSNLAFVNEYEAFFLGRNDTINRWGNVVSSYQTLPGLVGFWPMSSIQRSTGNAYDLSGQSRTLTYNGNPTYNYISSGVPYIDLDGTGDYLSRADETDLDIIGNESQYANPGLSILTWVWNDGAGATDGYVAKWTETGNQRAYRMQSISNGVRFSVSTDGAAETQVNSASTYTAATWIFCAGVFVPSTSLSVFLNAEKTTNTTSIPATIFNSTSDFALGAYGAGVQLLDGRITLTALCATALSDAIIYNIYQQTRYLFGV